MSRFTWEIILAVVSFASALGMLDSRRHYQGVQSPHRYASALFAWVPVWIGTYCLWHPLTKHYTRSFPWWLNLICVLLLLVGVLLSVSANRTRVNYLRIVRAIGAVLVFVRVFYIGWFGPNGRYLNVHHWWIGVLVVAFIVAALAFILFMVAAEFTVALAAALLAVILLVISLLGTPHISKKSHEAVSVQTTSASSSSAPPYHVRTADQCDPRFNVVYDDNIEKDLVSGGAPKDQYPTADSVIVKLTDAMKHDPRVLYVYYTSSPVQKLQPIKSETELRGTGQDDGCYSDKGVQAYNLYVAELSHATFTNIQAPSVGVNTGANPGGSAFQEPVGQIKGNLDAVQIKYQDGSVVIALRRCLNEELLAPSPSLPVVTPTATPTPTLTSKTTSPSCTGSSCKSTTSSPSCTPGSSGCTTTSNSPSPSCTPTPNVESCGKHQTYAPTPTGGSVVQCPNGQAVPRGQSTCAPIASLNDTGVQQQCRFFDCQVELRTCRAIQCRQGRDEHRFKPADRHDSTGSADYCQADGFEPTDSVIGWI